MAYKQNAGRGPMQKTGAGIPDTFKSPALQKQAIAKKLVPLREETYEEKVAASLKAIKDKKAFMAAKVKKRRQDNVLDSLKTIQLKGRDAAAEKYGDKHRGKGLPIDASEHPLTTEIHALLSRPRLKNLKRD